MEIAGKRTDMSSKSPKLNRQQVSLGREGPGEKLVHT